SARLRRLKVPPHQSATEELPPQPRDNRLLRIGRRSPCEAWILPLIARAFAKALPLTRTESTAACHARRQPEPARSQPSRSPTMCYRAERCRLEDSQPPSLR